MYTWERERESSKLWLWIILGVVLVVGLGTGIYFFTQQSSSENPSEDQSHQEKEAKEKMLEKYQTYFTEQDLPALISQMSYLGDQYSVSSLEEIVDRNLAIIKSKKCGLFSQFPHNKQEFEESWEKVKKEKNRFLLVSLIPRKSDGEVDWINWQKQEDEEEKLFTSTEIKNYLENKTNPALKKWSDDLKSDPDPVKRLALLNEQLGENMNITLPVWWLHKIGKEKGWIDKEYLSESFKVSFKDETNNQIEIDFDLYVKYDTSKWN